MVIKETRSDKIFNFINYFLLACVFLICLYPLWFIIIASISNPDLVNGGQVWFWPKDISFDGYKSLFADDGVMRGYVNTLIYTTGGTLINLAVTLPAAYALSRRDFVGRKFFTLMFLFTMFFSGGLIPTFLTVKSLGLYNNPWVMVILGATSMTNIFTGGRPPPGHPQLNFPACLYFSLHELGRSSFACAAQPLCRRGRSRFSYIRFIYKLRGSLRAVARPERRSARRSVVFPPRFLALSSAYHPSRAG